MDAARSGGRGRARRGGEVSRGRTGDPDVELLAHELVALATLCDHVSHDLRNSLASVLGFVQLLTLKVPEELRPLLARIEQRTRESAGLAAALPGFAPAPVTRVAPRDLLARLARGVAAPARARGVRIALDDSGDPPEALVCEPLVHAALRLAVAAQLEVARRGDVITLAVHATHAGPELEISRSGSGGASDPLARLCEPALGAPAAGLGLDLAQHLVALHGGHYRVLRNGAEVRIALRAAPVTATP
jgi:signal transduction histidine kinase